MVDLLDEENHHFICAEAANVDDITVNPGENHVLTLTLSLR